MPSSVAFNFVKSIANSPFSPDLILMFFVKSWSPTDTIGATQSPTLYTNVAVASLFALSTTV